MHRMRWLTTAVLGAWLLDMPVADVAAQVARPTVSDYVKAVNEAIYPQWAGASYSPNLQPDATCTARIVQMPDGELLSVDILPGCQFGSEGQANVIYAVRRSSPLPFRGYESVFQREISMTFHAASANDRKAAVDAAVAGERYRQKEATEEKARVAKMQAAAPYERYSNFCAGHLQSEAAKIRFKHWTEIMVTVNKSGKVVGVEDKLLQPLDDDVAPAFLAMSSCAPVPDGLANAGGTVKIGPVSTPNWPPDPPGSNGVCHEIPSGKICHE